MRKWANILGYSVFTALLIMGFISSWSLFNSTPSMDLRNRVVGARLTKAHISPYFYMWKVGDSMAFYDPHSMLIAYPFHQNTDPSAVTAAPIYHHSISWFTDLPQHQLNLIFFILFYVALFALIALLIMFSPKKYLGIILGFVAPIFISEQWNYNFFAQQNYILNAVFIAFGCWALLSKKQLFAALIFAYFFYYKFSTIIIFLPLLLFFYKEFLKFIVGFIALIISYSICIFVSPFERHMYAEYFHSIDRYFAMKLLNKSNPNYVMDLAIPYEGEDYKKSLKTLKSCSYYSASPTVNFCTVFLSRFKRFPTVQELKLITGSTMAIIASFIFVFRNGIKFFTHLQLLNIGLLIYFTLDFLTPMEVPYFRIQWLGVAVLWGLNFLKIPKAALICFFIGNCLSWYKIAYAPIWIEAHILPWCLVLLALLLSVVLPERKLISN